MLCDKLFYADTIRTMTVIHRATLNKCLLNKEV